MQWYDVTAQTMDAGVKYTRRQLVSLLRENSPSLNEGSYQWAVGGMLKSGQIVRTLCVRIDVSEVKKFLW